MTDNFSNEIDKLKIKERDLRKDINKRNEQEQKKLSTALVII